MKGRWPGPNGEHFAVDTLPGVDRTRIEADDSFLAGFAGPSWACTGLVEGGARGQFKGHLGRAAGGRAAHIGNDEGDVGELHERGVGQEEGDREIGEVPSRAAFGGLLEGVNFKTESAGEIIAPGIESAVVASGERGAFAGRDKGDRAGEQAADRRRPVTGGSDAQLAAVVRAPGPDHAFEGQREAVGPACRDGDDAPTDGANADGCGAVGNCAIAELATVVGTPRPESSVMAQGETVGLSGSDGQNPVQSLDASGCEA